MSEIGNFGFGTDPNVGDVLDKAQEQTDFSPDLKQDPKAISWLVEKLAVIYKQQLEEDAVLVSQGHEALAPLTESEKADMRTQLVWELAQLSQGASVEGMLFEDVFKTVNLTSLLDEYYRERYKGLNV